MRKWIIVFTVVLSAMIELLDTTIVNVSLPHMMGNLGATLDEIAWVVTAYVFANVIVMPMASWLSIVFGRRNYFVGSSLIEARRQALAAIDAMMSRQSLLRTYLDAFRIVGVMFLFCIALILLFRRPCSPAAVRVAH